MAKYSTRRIRERVVELLSTSREGIQFSDLVRCVASESPETPINTIKTQIGDMPKNYPDLIFRPAHGLFRLVDSHQLAVESSVNSQVKDGAQMLRSLGFMEMGSWEPHQGRIRFNLELSTGNTSVLYAFCINEEVMYLGKTTRSLMQRMQNYQTPGVSQATNIRNNGLIMEAIEAGKTVMILGLEENGELTYRGVEVSLIDGLEPVLIKRLKPSWNMRIG